MIENLYRLYFEELVSFATGMTQSPSLAEDLVQEAYLRALNHKNLMETLGKSQQRAWLYRTVKNLYLDMLRHQKYETTAEEQPEDGKEALEYGELANSELLEKLPEMERKLFSMRYLEGYNSTELGAVFGMAPATVRAKLALAREKLKKEWEEI